MDRQKKKKKYIRLAALSILTALLLAGGCGGKALKEEQALREEGISLLQAGDYDKAAETFTEALDQRKGKHTGLERDISLYLAQARLQADDVKGAIEVYDQLVEADGKDGDIYYLRGSAYLLLKDAEAALADYAKAEEYVEDQGSFYANACRQLAEAGQKEMGEQYFQKALVVAEQEKDADIYELLGRISLKSEEYARALDCFDKGLACQKTGNEAGLWSGKIAALEYTGDFKQAKQEMKKYIKAYPDDSHARREWQFLKTR